MQSTSLDRLLCLPEVRVDAVGLCEVEAGWRLRLPCPNSAVFPWLAMARGPISIFAHIVFGLVLGGVYRAVAGSEPEPRLEGGGYSNKPLQS